MCAVVLVLRVFLLLNVLLVLEATQWVAVSCYELSEINYQPSTNPANGDHFRGLQCENAKHFDYVYIVNYTLYKSLFNRDR